MVVLRWLVIASVASALAAVRQARQVAGSPAPDCSELATDRRKAGRLVSPACESLELSDKSAYLSIYLGLESQYHGAEAATVLAGKFRRFGGGFARPAAGACRDDPVRPPPRPVPLRNADRKSTRLNSSH